MKKNIYNEDVYLNGDIEAESFFKLRQLEWSKRIQQEKAEVKEITEKYNLLIQKIAYFIKQLGYTSSLECSMMISYLISHGYLSNYLQFEDKSPEFGKEIVSRMGTSIIYGEGCCRNYTDMHQDIFEELGLPIKSLYVYQGSTLFKKAKAQRANHVMSLIENKGKTYGIDLYNGNRVYSFITPFVLQEISTRSSLKAYNKPYYEIILDGYTPEDIKEELNYLSEISHQRSMDPYQLEDQIKYRTKKKMQFQESTLIDFHLSIQEEKENIAVLMKERFENFTSKK